MKQRQEPPCAAKQEANTMKVNNCSRTLPCSRMLEIFFDYLFISNVNFHHSVFPFTLQTNTKGLSALSQYLRAISDGKDISKISFCISSNIVTPFFGEVMGTKNHSFCLKFTEKTIPWAKSHPVPILLTNCIIYPKEHKARAKAQEYFLETQIFIFPNFVVEKLKKRKAKWSTFFNCAVNAT